MLPITRSIIFCFLSCMAFLAMAAPVPATTTAPDPLNSPGWDTMVRIILNQEPYVFDDRVKVVAPKNAEDSMNVPVSISITGLDQIETVVVFSELNPIAKVLTFKPIQADPYLAFRFKVQQSTPIRAAVKTEDGVWHVGGQWIDAAGGGCTTASVGMTSGNWTDTLGKVTAKRWRHEAEHSERLRLKIMHPMDTGLAPGIPAFYITDLNLVNTDGKTLMKMELFEPVNENPVLSFNFSKNAIQNQSIRLVGKDNNGNQFYAEIPKP